MDTNNETKLNIILVTPQLSIGGAESHVINLAIGLAQIGHSVSVISQGGDLVKYLEKAGIEFIRAPIGSKNIVNLIRSWFVLRQLLKTRKIDIIHVHAVIPAIICRLAAYNRKIPIISTGHGWSQNMYRLVSMILNITCDHMIVVSDLMRNKIIASGFPADRVTRIYNAIDFNEFNQYDDPDKYSFRQSWQIRKNDILIGLVGRMSEKRKGHAILLKAFKEVASDFPEARLILIGDGKLRCKIEKHIQNLNLSDRVIITGFRVDMPLVYSALDMLVVPSLWEGLPMVLLEGSACGKPVIATNVGGIPEVIIHEKTGLLVPPGDAKSLAISIKTLLKRPDWGKQMGEASKNRTVKLFNNQKMIQDTTRLYFHVLKTM
jgi:glycosyltransferase involved in cell wall biosynthesis